mmetsp:Transcript_7676/g.22546  ORF Transcript_7676/g.22546 Transcript_7676/m.22546 type:complete len:206 (-) Transcript_7676:1074-1691(-)
MEGGASVLILHPHGGVHVALVVGRLEEYIDDVRRGQFRFEVVEGAVHGCSTGFVLPHDGIRAFPHQQGNDLLRSEKFARKVKGDHAVIPAVLLGQYRTGSLDERFDDLQRRLTAARHEHRGRLLLKFLKLNDQLSHRSSVIDVLDHAPPPPMILPLVGYAVDQLMKSGEPLGVGILQKLKIVLQIILLGLDDFAKEITDARLTRT